MAAPTVAAAPTSETAPRSSTTAKEIASADDESSAGSVLADARVDVEDGSQSDCRTGKGSCLELQDA